MIYGVDLLEKYLEEFSKKPAKKFHTQPLFIESKHAIINTSRGI